MLAAAHDDVQPSRLVTVYLQAQPNSGFIPSYADRVIVAEPVSVIPVKRAEGKAVVQEIEVNIIGESCEQMRTKYHTLSGCEEVDTVKLEYGQIEVSATTDTEGFAALHLGDHEKYRLRVQSWVTREDAKCYWGGSEILERDDTTLKIPVLVFCE